MVIENDFEQVVSDSTKEYFSRLRSILGLSSASLTILVGLQSQFVPQQPRLLFLLQLSWVLLAVAIVLALFGVAGLHHLRFRFAEKLIDQALIREMRAAGRRGIYVPIPQPWRTCGRCAPWAFVLAMVCLCVFGVANIGHQPKPTNDNATQKASISARRHQGIPTIDHAQNNNPMDAKPIRLLAHWSLEHCGCS